MFKGRIGIWIAVLGLCFAISFFVKNIPIWASKTEIDIKADIIEDKDISNFLQDWKFKKHILKVNASSDYDIVVSSQLDTLEGFDKVEDAFYSPLVGWVSRYSIDHSEGFIRYSYSSSVRQIDLKHILEGIEKGLTWDKLDISLKVIKGNIILTIPDESSPYYKDVVELFYITLNDGKEVSDEDRENLKDRVDYILSKCSKVTSMVSAISSEASKPSVDGKFFIAPEYLYRRLGSAVSRDSNNNFIPVYFLYNTYLTADVFLRNTYEGDNIASNYFTLLRTKSKGDFFSLTGWRISDCDNNVTYYSSSLYPVIDLK